MSNEISRREFFSTSAKIAVACCFLPSVLEASEGKAFESPGKLTIDLDAPENAPLKSSGGAIYINSAAEKNPLIVWKQSDGSIKAFSSTCTHKGVELGLPKDGKIVCPAHGATFDANGKVLKAPAKDSLKEYKCALDGKTLSITLKG